MDDRRRTGVLCALAGNFLRHRACAQIPLSRRIVDLDRAGSSLHARDCRCESSWPRYHLAVSVMPANIGVSPLTSRPISQFSPPCSRFVFKLRLNEKLLISGPEIHLVDARSPFGLRILDGVRRASHHEMVTRFLERPVAEASNASDPCARANGDVAKRAHLRSALAMER